MYARGRVRPRRLRGRRRRARRRSSTARASRPGDVVIGAAVERPALERLLARAQGAPRGDGARLRRRARRSSAGRPSARRCSRRRASTRAHVQAMLGAGVDVRAMSHITGGGLPGNLPRVLPDGLGVRIDARVAARRRSSISSQRGGGVDEAEMRRTFNCGVGFVFVVAASDAARARRRARAASARRPSRLGRGRRACPPTARSRSACEWPRRDRARRPRLRQRHEPPGDPRRDRRGDARRARRGRRLERRRRRAPRPRARARASRPSSSITRRSPIARGLRRRARRGRCARAASTCVVLAGFMRLVTRRAARRLPDARRQHPPGAPARVPGRRRAEAGARLRRARHRLHRALRRRGHRHGPDHRAGRRAGARRTTTRSALRRASSRRSTSSCRGSCSGSRRGGSRSSRAKAVRRARVAAASRVRVRAPDVEALRRRRARRRHRRADGGGAPRAAVVARARARPGLAAAARTRYDGVDARAPALHVPRGLVAGVGPRPRRARAVADVPAADRRRSTRCSRCSRRACASRSRPTSQLFAREIDREFPEVRRVVDELYAELARTNAAADAAFERDVVWPPGSFWERRETERVAATLPHLATAARADAPRRVPARPRLPRHRRRRRRASRATRVDAPAVRGGAPARRVDARRRGASPAARTSSSSSWSSASAPTAARRGSSDRAARIVHKRGHVAGVVVDGDDDATGVDFVVTDHTTRGPARPRERLRSAAPRARRAAAPLAGRAALRRLDRRARRGPPRRRSRTRRSSCPVAAAAGSRSPRPSCTCSGWRAAVRRRRARRCSSPRRCSPRARPCRSRGAREAVLATRRGALPFVERHYVVVDSPHDGRPLWDFRSGQRARRSTARAARGRAARSTPSRWSPRWQRRPAGLPRPRRRADPGAARGRLRRRAERAARARSGGRAARRVGRGAPHHAHRPAQGADAARHVEQDRARVSVAPTPSGRRKFTGSAASALNDAADRAR